MKCAVRLVTLAALVSLVSCTPPPPPAPPAPLAPLQTPEQMIESAKAVDAAFVAAFNAGDGAGIAATYWNDPSTTAYLPDSMAMEGFETIQSSLLQNSTGPGGPQLQLTSSRYIPIGEDSVVSHGLWTITMPAAEGETPAEMKGRFTALMQRKGDRWYYVVDHASVPLPAPPAPAAASAPAP